MAVLVAVVVAVVVAAVVAVVVVAVTCLLAHLQTGAAKLQLDYNTIMSTVPC